MSGEIAGISNRADQLMVSARQREALEALAAFHPGSDAGSFRQAPADGT